MGSPPFRYLGQKEKRTVLNTCLSLTAIFNPLTNTVAPTSRMHTESELLLPLHCHDPAPSHHHLLTELLHQLPRGCPVPTFTSLQSIIHHKDPPGHCCAHTLQRPPPLWSKSQRPPTPQSVAKMIHVTQPTCLSSESPGALPGLSPALAGSTTLASSCSSGPVLWPLPLPGMLSPLDVSKVQCLASSPLCSCVIFWAMGWTGPGCTWGGWMGRL